MLKTMSNVDLVEKFGTRLNQKQTYHVIIMIVIFTTMLSVISLYRQSNLIIDVKQTNKQVIKSIDDLTYMLKLKNKNNLTITEAIYLYRSVFSNSMNEITRMSMISISHNNIESSVRQKQLKKNYTVSIMNLYNSDYTALDRFRCNGVKLSGVMDNIHPLNVRDNVLKLMFDSTRTHSERRLDIEEYLRIQAEAFTEQAKKFIK